MKFGAFLHHHIYIVCCELSVLLVQTYVSDLIDGKLDRYIHLFACDVEVQTKYNFIRHQGVRDDYVCSTTFHMST